MDRCTGRRDITEILLKTALNTTQSINHSNTTITNSSTISNTTTTTATITAIIFTSAITSALPGWLSGERVGLMTWWLRIRSPVEATFLSGVFFASHLCRSMWEKESVALERKVLLVLV